MSRRRALRAAVVRGLFSDPVPLCQDRRPEPSKLSEGFFRTARNLPSTMPGTRLPLRVRCAEKRAQGAGEEGCEKY